MYHGAITEVHYFQNLPVFVEGVAIMVMDRVRSARAR